MENGFVLEHGIAWDDSLLLGNELVDRQHQRMFEMLSDLVHACEDGCDAAKLEETLNYLFYDYTIKHFIDEEALQIEYGYPDHEAHRKKHEEFSETVKGLVEEFKESGSSAGLSRNVNRVVVRWLVDHIYNEDRKLGMYLRTAANDG